MYAGDIAPLLIGAGLLIIVYFAIDILIRRIKQKTTFYADIIAPIVAFIVSIIGSLIIWSSQDWSLLLPLVIFIAIIPTSLLLTLIKTGIVISKKKGPSP